MEMLLPCVRPPLRPRPGAGQSHEEAGVSAEPETVMAALGPAEARRLTDEVKRDVQALWAKLVKLYDGGAHLALGYPSWAGYMTEEFGVGQSQAYRLLDAGRVVAAIEGHSPNGEPLPANEAQARALIPVLRECGPEAVAAVWRDARERGDAETAERLGDAIAWAQWEGDWEDLTGTPAPTLEAFKESLKKPLLDPGGEVLFPGFAKIDEEAARQAHCSCVTEHFAPRVLLTSGKRPKYPPPPPSFSIPPDGTKPTEVRREKWNRILEYRAGGILLIADALSDDEDTRSKGIARARSFLRESRGLVGEWDDEAVRTWARGYVYAAMGGRA
jgi:hypothetical protein